MTARAQFWFVFRIYIRSLWVRQEYKLFLLFSENWSSVRLALPQGSEELAHYRGKSWGMVVTGSAGYRRALVPAWSGGCSPRAPRRYSFAPYDALYLHWLHRTNAISCRKCIWFNYYVAISVCSQYLFIFNKSTGRMFKTISRPAASAF